MDHSLFNQGPFFMGHTRNKCAKIKKKCFPDLLSTITLIQQATGTALVNQWFYLASSELQALQKKPQQSLEGNRKQENRSEGGWALLQMFVPEAPWLLKLR